jgi:hypothetical protein
MIDKLLGFLPGSNSLFKRQAPTKMRPMIRLCALFEKMTKLEPVQLAW